MVRIENLEYPEDFPPGKYYYGKYIIILYSNK